MREKVEASRKGPGRADAPNKHVVRSIRGVKEICSMIKAIMRSRIWVFLRESSVSQEWKDCNEDRRLEIEFVKPETRGDRLYLNKREH
jgi:hypothetical protein